MNLLRQPIDRVLKTTKDRKVLLRERGIETLEDLLFYFPWRYSDESEFTRVIELVEGEVQTIKGVVSGLYTRRTRAGKLMIRCYLEDESGKLEVMWFGQAYLKRLLQNGMELIVTGKPKLGRSKVTMMSPKYEVPQGDTLVHTGRVVPVYHSVGKLTPKWFRDKIYPLLYLVDQIKDYLPSGLLREEDLMPLGAAVKEVHFPEGDELLAKAKARLAFDELFLLQLGAMQRKWYWQQKAAENPNKLAVDKKVVQEFLAGLPFELTNAQKAVLDELLVDLERPYPMSRLVEGDVGSGKTVVAAAALMATIKGGFQGLLMAPTEILAKQHYQNLFKYLQKHGVNLVFLAGSSTKSEKERIYEQLRQGTADLVVGTHALLQDKVEFKRLGLAIVDEQHRFGVKQREILKSFGAPHLLSLTATPIPRTLALTIYGDQDVSIIDELPPGRQEIITRVVPEKKRKDAYLWIEDQVRKGRQVFVVCPLIEGSDDLQAKAVCAEHKRLSEEVFPDLQLGLLHGRMRQKDKDAVMADFSENKIQVLVSTTVIEVGIDVPNATIMLVEGAERFGLAQLHQLRGRVGRGEHQSYCFLFPDGNSDETKRRMAAMVDYSDGFKLAEIDLEMRGPGEVYGVRQSGIPDLRMASLGDKTLIAKAQRVATNFIENDPELQNYPLLREKVVSLDKEFGIDY